MILISFNPIVITTYTPALILEENCRAKAEYLPVKSDRRKPYWDSILLMNWDFRSENRLK
jgi:hypothetical protein